ncbi:MAG: ABC transporter permease [Pirellulales bacterium]|nr:ABC transporter permease [Pirellulales bacterium]
MSFFSIPLKSLLRRRTRSALTILGLGIALAAVISLVGISQGFERSFVRMYQRRGVDLLVQRSGGGNRKDKTLSVKLDPKLRAIKGVRDVDGGLMDMIAMPEFDQFAIILNGLPGNSPELTRANVIDGRRLEPTDERSLMLGKVLALNIGAKVGDDVKIYEQPYKVVGIYESPTVFENGGAIILLEDLQRLTDLNGKVTGFAVSIDHPGNEAEVARIAREIQALEPHLEAMRPDKLVAEVQEVKAAKATAWITSAIALVIGAIGMLNTMVMSVFERTREIGTLRAIGWRKSRVMRLILLEATFLSISGAVAGAIAAVGITKIMSSLPLTNGYIGSEIAPAVFVQGFVIALLVGFFGSLYPAWWGASLSPIEALRRK